jgi:xanthine/uracil permease
MKKFLQSKFVKNILAPIVRGAVKTIPGGGIAVELIQNIGKENQEKKPHHWLSITIQILGIAAIIYAFLTKAITVEAFIELINRYSPE